MSISEDHLFVVIAEEIDLKIGVIRIVLRSLARLWRSGKCKEGKIYIRTSYI